MPWKNPQWHGLLFYSIKTTISSFFKEGERMGNKGFALGMIRIFRKNYRSGTERITAE